CCPPVIWCC
uniref:Conotoxin tx5f n=1 Tax=Conus textile TaxID=6494 RepID=CT5F_CONTE|nr:RecName: Full=Conotoxin tx5f; AltName: Full=Conotoxin Tx5.2 [Conus textile]